MAASCQGFLHPKIRNEVRNETRSEQYRLGIRAVGFARRFDFYLEREKTLDKN
jgi:hypothetical protein